MMLSISCLFKKRRIIWPGGLVCRKSIPSILHLWYIGIVYVLFWELVLVLELFIQWQKNWYWYWNCLYYVWRIGIGTGIVYTMTEDLVLVLELFTQWLKNWYWYWNCLYYVWRIGIVLELFILCLKNWYWYWSKKSGIAHLCIARVLIKTVRVFSISQCFLYDVRKKKAFCRAYFVPKNSASRTGSPLHRGRFHFKI